MLEHENRNKNERQTKLIRTPVRRKHNSTQYTKHTFSYAINRNLIMCDATIIQVL